MAGKRGVVLAKLDSDQVCLQLHILVLLCPEVQRDGRQFIDYWDRESILGKVYRLDVVVTGVAGLNSHIVELTRGVDR